MKLVQEEETLYKTAEKKKTVNPVWNETFDVYIENPFVPVMLHVYDKDMVGSDDFMGQGQIDLSSWDLNKSVSWSKNYEFNGRFVKA